MGKMYRSAMGKQVDMDRLRLSNEETIAVGNNRVNARGDKIGPGGVVVKSRNQTMDQHYNIEAPAIDSAAAEKMQQEQAASGARVTRGRAVPANNKGN